MSIFWMAICCCYYGVSCLGGGWTGWGGRGCCADGFWKTLSGLLEGFYSLAFIFSYCAGRDF